MLDRVRMAIFTFAASWALGATAPRAHQARHYPRVISAKVPLYPPLAWSAHISGVIKIQITVDEGRVVNAQIKAESSPALSVPAMANIETWRFGSEKVSTFVVTYIYRIQGEETALPETPKVELDLPCTVTVTAKPFKPTCSDCLPTVGPEHDQRR